VDRVEAPWSPVFWPRWPTGWSSGPTRWGPIAALRETSVVLAAWVGTRWLREPFGRRRTLAAAVVGIVLMNV